MSAVHRAPSACPVCADALATTRLGCRSCGSELSGVFAPCSFCALDAADLDLLTVFLASNGNLKAVEKHLGVSYPTARARYAAVLARLGLAAVPGTDEAEASAMPEAQDAVPEPGDAGQDADVPAPAQGGNGDDVRDSVLARVASGDLAPDLAADLLARLSR